MTKIGGDISLYMVIKLISLDCYMCIDTLNSSKLYIPCSLIGIADDV